MMFKKLMDVNNDEMDREELLIYNTVLNNLPSDQETSEVYIEGIQKKVGKLDAMTADVIYAFIRRYQLEENQEMTVDKFKGLPYGCKLLKKGLKIDLALLPPKLLTMLYVFLTKYYNADSESDG